LQNTIGDTTAASPMVMTARAAVGENPEAKILCKHPVLEFSSKPASAGQDKDENLKRKGDLHES
jgi:hypothetical protein